MTAIEDMAGLFQDEPPTWGGRGDPYLWQEMASTFAGVPLPATAAQCEALLADTFARLVGTALDAAVESVFVPRLSHGGMSSGYVSLLFWRATAMPLLLARHAAALAQRHAGAATPQAPSCWRRIFRSR
ncbi:hypothetical protein QE400_001420 [Xanthomonas sacchari]|uniref:hypothetical protein n=1 Tax=Xanthomonas sacchari TaxID=56458 RepID=UPI00277DE175|nr:hypothetical protein [Xanthomonas sacchari]MDQ1092007.1 hypothetical protein [Xanthomonas sacchari]